MESKTQIFPETLHFFADLNFEEQSNWLQSHFCIQFFYYDTFGTTISLQPSFIDTSSGFPFSYVLYYDKKQIVFLLQGAIMQ